MKRQSIKVHARNIVYGENEATKIFSNDYRIGKKRRFIFTQLTTCSLVHTMFVQLSEYIWWGAVAGDM